MEFIDNEYSNDNAKKMLLSLFDSSPFDYSKPVSLIKYFAAFSTSNDDIILDFFSGSATTAHAVMQLNAEDGGNRRYILVQLQEVCDEKSEAYKSGYKNICEIGKERIRLAGKKIRNEELGVRNQIKSKNGRVMSINSKKGEITMFDAKKTAEQCIEWIKEYFKANGNGCNAVVGISGGKDSSLVAALCVKALGKERVIGVLMPQGQQHDIDYSNALCDFFNIKKIEINIGEAVSAVKASITGAIGEINEQARINIPPRVRMTTLYAVSACFNGRVANTCNLSEDYVGYSTKFGDAAGDFSPLSNLTVTEIKAMGYEIGLPSKFIEKTPIDGLCGKTDEENLGFTYAELDKYIRGGEYSDENIKASIDRKHLCNLHKLRLMPSFMPQA